MQFHVITLFPHALQSYIDTSLIKRAREKKIITVNFVNPRDYTKDSHHKVDDTPYGGGPGMVMQAEPIYHAVNFVKSKIYARTKKKLKVRTILFSTRGTIFNQSTARRLSKYDHLIFICGRYEGVDERVAQHIADEEISLGDFVLAGGELPAMVCIEAVARHVKGVLGTEESLEEKKGSYPTYTKPDILIFKKNRTKKILKVPEVLLLGDHKKIAAWRLTYGTRGGLQKS